MQLHCRTCKRRRPQEEFTNKHGTILATCNGCRTESVKGVKRRWQFRRRFLWTQRGRCGICKKTITKKAKAQLDHNHKTGKVRGILCRRCNWLIAIAKDDTKVLFNAVTYLEYHLTS